MNRVTIILDTTNITKLNDIIRLALGLAGLSSPEVAVSYRVDALDPDPEPVDEPF